MTLAKSRALALERQAIWRAADEALREADMAARYTLDSTRYALDRALSRGTLARGQWDAAMERAWERYAADMAPAYTAYDTVADMLWPEERRAAIYAAYLAMD